MPFTTDAICEKCDHTWEAWLKSSSDTDIQCPECNSREVKRLLGGVITKCHDPEVRKEVLKKRSIDHGRKTLPDNVERVRNKLKLK